MGKTNLKEPLERKLSLLGRAERQAEAHRADRNSVPRGTAGTYCPHQRVQRLIECAEELLLEIAPPWKPERVKAVRPNVHKAPTAIGRISKATLIIMRQAGEPLTIREIADRLLATEVVGGVEDDVH